MNRKKLDKLLLCSECGKKNSESEIFLIDGKKVCARCIYGDVKPFKIFPIGRVINKLKRVKKGFGTISRRGVSCIELLESQRPFLYKIDDEKYITIVYYLHETNEVFSVFNRGLDGKRVGVFASRTPYRLSKIAIQDVRLVKIEGNKLYVEGLDAVNGSPVLDIKMKWSKI